MYTIKVSQKHLYCFENKSTGAVYALGSTLVAESSQRLRSGHAHLSSRSDIASGTQGMPRSLGDSPTHDDSATGVS